MEDGADGLDGGAEAVVAGVVDPFLDYVVGEDFVGGNVGFVDCEAGVLFGGAFGGGVDDVEAVEDVLDCGLVFFGEDFASVEVFVGLEVAVGKEAHDNAEEVFLTVDGFFGEV